MRLLGSARHRDLRSEDKRQDVPGKTRQAFLEMFLEVETLELEYELAFAATCYLARSCWEGLWDDDWRRDIFLAVSSGKVRGLAGAVCCEFTCMILCLTASPFRLPT